jgi:hypothetical protein
MPCFSTITSLVVRTTAADSRQQQLLGVRECPCEKKKEMTTMKKTLPQDRLGTQTHTHARRTAGARQKTDDRRQKARWVVVVVIVSARGALTLLSG